MVAAAVHGTAAVAAPAIGTVMYPDNDDGDDNDDPEGLVVGEKATAVAGHTVVITVGVHKRDSLLDRFLTPYYSVSGEV